MPPSCRAVELGHDEARNPRFILEHFHLVKRILPGGCIEHQQYLMRRASDQSCAARESSFPARPSAPACSAGGRRYRSATRRCRFARAAFRASKASPAASAPDPTRDHLGTRALAPDLELVDGRGPEGIAGRQCDLLCPAAPSGWASLPMVVVLPVPLTPTTRMTCGWCSPSSDSGLATGGQRALDLGRQHGAHLVGRNLLVEAALAPGPR